MSGSAVNFAAFVEDWVKETQGLLTAVFRSSVQDVVEEMQKVGPSVASTRAAAAAEPKRMGAPVTGAGGRMPVDTGYLRASLQMTKGAPVAMESSSNPAGPKVYNESAVSAVIMGLEIGDTAYASYTAAYARRVNYGFTGTDSLGREISHAGYHFVEMAAMKWPQIVATNVERLRTAMQEGSGV